MARFGVLGKPVLRSLGFRRRHVASLRMRVERSFLASSAPRLPAASGRILCYHGIGAPEWGVNDVTPRRFRRQIELALRTGYQFIGADAIARGDGGARHLALTFDDGLASVATEAVPVLKDLGVAFTVFVVTDWADGLHSFGPSAILGWQDLERLMGCGATIGSHSIDHADFGRLPDQEVYRQLRESRLQIERRLGVLPSSFAIPYGRPANWTAFAGVAAKQAGYDFVYAQAHKGRPAGTVPRTFISRFDDDRLFTAALNGAFDDWQEWW